MMCSVGFSCRLRAQAGGAVHRSVDHRTHDRRHSANTGFPTSYRGTRSQQGLIVIGNAAGDLFASNPKDVLLHGRITSRAPSRPPEPQATLSMWARRKGRCLRFAYESDRRGGCVSVRAYRHTIALPLPVIVAAAPCANACLAGTAWPGPPNATERSTEVRASAWGAKAHVATPPRFGEHPVLHVTGSAFIAANVAVQRRLDRVSYAMSYHRRLQPHVIWWSAAARRALWPQAPQPPQACV
jgi:hypothetical protein